MLSSIITVALAACAVAAPLDAVPRMTANEVFVAVSNPGDESEGSRGFTVIINDPKGGVVPGNLRATRFEVVSAQNPDVTCSAFDNNGQVITGDNGQAIFILSPDITQRDNAVTRDRLGEVATFAVTCSGGDKPPPPPGPNPTPEQPAPPANNAPTPAPAPPANNNNNNNNQYPADKPYVYCSFEIRPDTFAAEMIFLNEPFSLVDRFPSLRQENLIAAEIRNDNCHSGATCELFSDPNGEQPLRISFGVNDSGIATNTTPINRLVGSVICRAQ